ncbi:hypothetical protein Tco_0299568, partial [Tanacetum coccineum]
MPKASYSKKVSPHRPIVRGKKKEIEMFKTVWQDNMAKNNVQLELFPAFWKSSHAVTSCSSDSESLERDIDGIEELLLSDLFILWLTKVSTDSAKPSPTIPIPDSIPKGSCRNHGGQSSNDRSLSGNEDGLTLQSIKQLKKKAKLVISHHNAWIKSVSIKKKLARKKLLKKKWMQKESVSKQGRKSAKSTPTAHTDQVFDDVDVNDAMDYMETDAYMQKGFSTEDQVSTVKLDKGTDKPKVSTNKPEVSTVKPKEVEV